MSGEKDPRAFFTEDFFNMMADTNRIIENIDMTLSSINGFLIPTVAQVKKIAADGDTSTFLFAQKAEKLYARQARVLKNLKEVYVELYSTLREYAKIKGVI